MCCWQCCHYDSIGSPTAAGVSGVLLALVILIMLLIRRYYFHITCAGAGLPGEHLFPSSSSGAGAGAGSFAWAAGAGVQRPRLLICGGEGAGQSHLGPAVLYALEGLPVHAIGLPSLLSDAGARWGSIP